MEENSTFKDLGLVEELCDACDRLQWTAPTPIQKEAIPVALNGSDLVGLAETGSGKTGAFGLPILQALLLKPQKMFALILTPTRELAIQIKEQLDDLGKDIGLSCVAVVGGVDVAAQAIELIKRPHIMVATLGRLVLHINKVNGFSGLLKTIKYLVMDEADRILSQDYEDDLDKIIRVLPRNRTTMLFSATITPKVRDLQRQHLKTAATVQINSSFKLVDTLKQYVIPLPFTDRHVYLLHLIQTLGQESMIVFCNTRQFTIKTALILRQCSHTAIPIYGDMSQSKRLQALEKFKQKERSILVATNVASRGLDIPCVDYVINFEVPSNTEDYIHRVGRTARAGRTGTAITFVSQYDVDDFLRIEQTVMKESEKERIDVYPIDKRELLKCTDAIIEAEKEAKREMRRIDNIHRANKGGYSQSDEEDDDGGETEGATGVRKRFREEDSRSHTATKPKKTKTIKKKKRRR